MKRIVLWSCFALTLACFLGVYYFIGVAGENPSQTPKAMSVEERIVASLVSDSIHRERIKQRVKELKRESLDESFARLLDDQQYFYPGYSNNAETAPVDLETLLSARCFLKVFQEFRELPYEVAIKKLNEFSKKAINNFDILMGTDDASQVGFEDAAALKQYREYLASLPSKPNSRSARFMVYSTMLLVASLGEKTLLVNLIDEAQRVVDASLNRINENDNYPADFKAFLRFVVSLEDDCMLSILIYALERAGGDLEKEGLFDTSILDRKIIPLFRWDAEWTHYDHHVVSRQISLDPNDAVELLAVYEFPRLAKADSPERQKRKIILDTLKEHLSK